jgi:outer membrane protein insertion porin family
MLDKTRFLTTLLIVLTAPLFAAPQQFKLVTLHATGSTHFDEDDIARYTGLKIGANFTQDQLQEVANKLASSGVFAEVNYNFKPVGTGVGVDFVVKDADLLPARFENFVWFDNDELRARLHEAVPLFKGDVSLSGDVAQKINDALISMLTAKGVTASVGQRFHSVSAGAPPDAVVYLVQGVTIAINKVEFPGATHLSGPELDRVRKLITSNGYEYGLIFETSRMELMRHYGRLGFLRAEIRKPEIKVSIADLMNPSVEVAIPVTENDQYSMADVAWNGNRAFTAEDLQKQFKMRAGEIADISKIDQGLGSVAGLYGTKGFLQVQFKRRAEYDSSTKKVAFTLEITEGDQFRMGKLDIRGLPPELSQKLAAKWKLQSGQTFDNSYVRQFLKESGNLLPPHKVNVSIAQKANDDKTVDIGLIF